MARQGALDLGDSPDALTALAVGLGLYFIWQYLQQNPGAGASLLAPFSPSPAYSPATGQAYSAPATSAPATVNGGVILAPMQVSAGGVAFIMGEESFSPTPYNDAGGQAIGYGHTIRAGDQISPPISQAQGLQLLQQDLAPVAAAINNAVTVPLDQNQFDALASLTYDIGIGAFQGSTLLQQLNAGNYGGAAQQFALWNKSQGKVNAGLVARRGNESDLFLS